MEDHRAFLIIEVGGDVLSHRGNPAVPSAQRGLTSEFGMGSGGSPAPWPPNLCMRGFEDGREEKEKSRGWIGPVHMCVRCLVLKYKPVKPHGSLVRLGYSGCPPSTCRLSTWWSPTALQGSYDPGGFILGRASHLDAFSGSPVPT